MQRSATTRDAKRRSATRRNGHGGRVSRETDAGLHVAWLALPELLARLEPENPRKHDLPKLKESIRANGFVAPPLLNEKTGRLVFGHGRALALQELHREAPDKPPARIRVGAGGWLVPVLRGLSFETQEEALRYLLADNRVAELGGWELPDLGAMLARLQSSSLLVGSGWGKVELDRLLRQLDESRSLHLTDRFLVPPFSVLDSRQGYWRERQSRWGLLGLHTAEGRAENLGKWSDNVLLFRSGTSIFDPVLAELIYRWFSPPGGRVLDPFAGGPVRGVVAGLLGRTYLGVDLRREQVEANRVVAERVFSALAQSAKPSTSEPEEQLVEDPDALTPVEHRGGVWLKRDDLFVCNGARGSKARALLRLAAGARGLTCAGARRSPMVSRVARLGEKLGIAVRCHVAPSKELTDQEEDAVAHGAELVKHKVGYLKTLVAKSRADAAEREGWRHVELGVESDEYLEANAAQAANVPPEAKRVVLAVGSGMGLACVLHGLDRAGLRIPVVAVSVGFDPVKLLDRRAPAGWRERVTIIKPEQGFDEQARKTSFEGVDLDPHYEAKCIPFLQPGDCFYLLARRSTPTPIRRAARAPALPTWIEGDSREATKLLAAETPFDLVFSCPPYFDLEKYSTDPADLSNMEWAEFLAGYRTIVAEAIARLRDDRFACFVVAEIRDPNGLHRRLVSETIDAFERAGARFYNDAVLIEPFGDKALRAGRIFSAGRKLLRTHQNVLVFCKGDPERAAQSLGEIEIEMPEQSEAAT